MTCPLKGQIKFTSLRHSSVHLSDAKGMYSECRLKRQNKPAKEYSE